MFNIQELLREPLAQIDSIHRITLLNGIFMSTEELEHNMNLLQTYSNELSKLKQYIARVELACKHVIEHRFITSGISNTPSSICTNKQEKNNNEELISDYKCQWCSLPYLEYEIAPKTYLNAVVVNSPNDVPNTPLCWIRDSNAFAIKIDNQLIFGNIGEIYTKHSPKDEMINVSLCKNGEKCKDIYCKYWHPTLGKSLSPMNFLSSSWIYTSEPFQLKNKYMRHVGNKSTFFTDLMLIKEHISNTRSVSGTELSNNREKSESTKEQAKNKYWYKDICARAMSQLMHDLLVYRALINISS